MTTIATLGVWCARLQRDRWDITACEAFPEGIPKAIRLMEHDHQRLSPDDHGLHFAAEPGTENLVPEDHA